MEISASNLDVYKKRRTAVLISGDETESLVKELIENGWDIVSLEDFLNNLPLWHPKEPNSEEIVNLLFSDSVPGVKQFLANQKDMNVGLSNVTNETHQPLMYEYQRKGYDIVSIDCKTILGKRRQTMEYIPCPTQKVYVKRKNFK